ncbi:MAG: class II glutamine amidotransferase [Candidatus Hodarchaeales archaeon]|jgi:predicted glutamine amidotransferase
MCRLLGIYGSVSLWKDFLFKFQELSEKGKVPPVPGVSPGHKDGWGMASSRYNSSGMELVGKYMGEALGAPEFGKRIHSFEHQPRVFLCHLRKASTGISTSLPNNHPFLSLDWAFIHNGTVYNAESLNPNSELQTTSENSDSEHLFHYLLSSLIEGSDIEARTMNLIDSLSQVSVEYTSLNCVLTNGAEMYTIRSVSRHHDYYTMFYYETGSGIVVCSENIDVKGISGEGWTEMPNQSVLAVSKNPPKVKLTKF